ncbi:hypothetical protein NQZ68_026816 [Dissostichus eleginoides]|nr:hypothetical protein NQZ68_026816 [Dissostichus eleginoides]
MEEQRGRGKRRKSNNRGRGDGEELIESVRDLRPTFNVQKMPREVHPFDKQENNNSVDVLLLLLASEALLGCL